MKNILATLCAVFASTLLFSQAPQALNYQAVARKADGSVVTGQAIGVRFSILEGTATGALLYEETHQSSTNNFGLFTLFIGKGRVTKGNFSAIPWGRGAKFLKVEIAPQAGGNYLLQGVTQLLSVPYALYAESSGSAGPQGPPGPQGPVGTTGPAGPQGPDGMQGLQGPPGTPGARGDQGPAGAAGPVGPQGAKGTDGHTIFNGAVDPAIAVGLEGDFYLNTLTRQLFGPKTASGWGTGINLQGPQGPPGLQGVQGPAGQMGPAGPQGSIGTIGPPGPQGAKGVDGRTIFSGVINPATTIGVDGDFYLNTATNQLFGPKAAGGWSGSVSLTGPQGSPGLKSLIDLGYFSANATCATGGIIVKSGVDRNNNNVLDASEVDNTKNICFTQSSSPQDKLIMIPLGYGYSHFSTSPYVFKNIVTVLKFNKNNYPGVDSITLVCNPSVWDANNTSTVQLYNVTDGKPVVNQVILSSSQMIDNGREAYLESDNLFSALPNYDVSLGISIKSGVEGKTANVGYCYLYLYRK